MLIVIRHLVLDLGSLVFPRLSIFQKEVHLQKSKLLILLILLNIGLKSYMLIEIFQIKRTVNCLNLTRLQIAKSTPLGGGQGVVTSVVSMV